MCCSCLFALAILREQVSIGLNLKNRVPASFRISDLFIRFSTVSSELMREALF